MSSVPIVDVGPYTSSSRGCICVCPDCGVACIDTKVSSPGRIDVGLLGSGGGIALCFRSCIVCSWSTAPLLRSHLLKFCIQISDVALGLPCLLLFAPHGSFWSVRRWLCRLRHILRCLGAPLSRADGWRHRRRRRRKKRGMCHGLVDSDGVILR